MNTLCMEHFLSELKDSAYVAVACAQHAHNKVSPGECATLHLATKHGIVEGKAQPVKGRAALEKFTEVVFPDGQSKFVLNEEVLPQNVGDVLFLTQGEQELLTEIGLLIVQDLAETQFDITQLSMKLQSKLLPYVNGLYIRRNGKMISGEARMSLPGDGVYVIHNPNGSQDSPDFVFLWGNKCLPLEDKTSKGGKILWNSGLAQDGYLYSFSCQTSQQHFFFMGEDYSSTATREKLMHKRSELAQMVEEFNAELKVNAAAEEYEELYVRPMYNAQLYDVSANKIGNHEKALEKLLNFDLSVV